MKSLLTSISIILGVGLVAALAGVLGTYYTLSQAPGAPGMDASDRQIPTSPDSLVAQTLGRDSTAQEEASGGMGRGGGSEEEQLQALRDSIDTLNRRLQATRDTTDTLRTKLAAIEADQAKVNELSNALMDMRRRNLSNLLTDVEMSVLKRLYQETAGRARTRLLQALAPAQAAQFVNQVVEDPEGTAGPESDTSSTAE